MVMSRRTFPKERIDGRIPLQKQMMDDPLSYFVVEYSMTLNSVHRRSLRKLIDNNQSNLRKGHSSDFVPIGLFPSREAADKFIERFSHTLAEQAQTEFHRRDWRHVADVIEDLIQQSPANRLVVVQPEK